MSRSATPEWWASGGSNPQPTDHKGAVSRSLACVADARGRVALRARVRRRGRAGSRLPSAGALRLVCVLVCSEGRLRCMPSDRDLVPVAVFAPHLHLAGIGPLEVTAARQQHQCTGIHPRLRPVGQAYERLSFAILEVGHDDERKVASLHEAKSPGSWTSMEARPRTLGVPGPPSQPAVGAVCDSARGAIGRGDRSFRPSRPPSSYRRRHVCIVCRDTSHRDATSTIECPSAITAGTA